MKCAGCNKEGEEDDMVYLVVNDCFVHKERKECKEIHRLGVDGLNRYEHEKENINEPS